MASISRDKRSGNRRILFVTPEGDRKAIWMGKAAKRTVDAVKVRVEQLLSAQITGHAVDADTARWLAELKPALANKLIRAGLMAERADVTTTTLGGFLVNYVASREDVKPATRVVWGHVQRNLVAFFGEDRDVRKITPGDGDDFKQFLIRDGLSSTTINKRIKLARSFFHAMRRRKLIDENPFEGVKAAATGTQDRQRFVSRDEITRVLDACPDHHWRTIVALARFGGLRTPSETLSVRWQDIDWDAGRIVVTSPKTEHHAGKATRTIPLFAELRPYLDEAWERAPEGAVFVVDPRFRRSANKATGWANTNLRTTFLKIIQRAGLEPWPRLFHNLRASRETELVESYPVQVVTGWLGNTPAIAMKHYLMTTDDHFEAAVTGDLELTRIVAQSASRKASQRSEAAHQKPHVLPTNATKRMSVQNKGMEPKGFEPSTSALRTQRSPS